MSAYYNEIDPFCAAWLRNLIAADLIPPGEVDERSIIEVRASDLGRFGQCHFFAGIGGWALAARLAGWPDDRPLWTGSPPCQPFSGAGLQRGLSDERHLWPDLFRLIEGCRPDCFVGEQVAAAVGKHWLDQVRDDLEGIGYACGSVVLPACAVNAPHRRDRLWTIAHAERDKQSRAEPRHGQAGRVGRQFQPVSWDRDWESALREFRALDDGLSYGVAATDAPRNAIVPALAAEVLSAYMEAA